MSNFFFKNNLKSSETRLFFATNRSGLLDFSWSTKDNHVIKVFCHAAPPNFGDVQPGFRQYDLSLDGQVSRASSGCYCTSALLSTTTKWRSLLSVLL